MVIKPTVAAGAYETYKVDAHNIAEMQKKIDVLLTRHDMIIQPFFKEVLDGEWSLIFFGDEYSHSVFKKPKKGDYRVQDDHGGTVHFKDPDAKILETALGVIRYFEVPPLYTRVDGLIREGVFYVMEVEAFEPELFLRAHPYAAKRFADKIESIL